MTPIEQTLIITLCLLLAVWIAMLGAVLLLAWRFRKTIMAVVFAVRGLRTLHGQLREMAGAVNALKHKMNATKAR